MKQARLWDDDGEVTPDENDHRNLPLVAMLVSAYVSHNQCPIGELPKLIRDVAVAMGGEPSAVTNKTPAVNPRKSVGEDFIICLEDGKKLKTLKRYLMAQYDLTPEAYRRKWGLPADYPMVAPAYSRLRSAFAKKVGLGKGGNTNRKKK